MDGLTDLRTDGLTNGRVKHLREYVFKKGPLKPQEKYFLKSADSILRKIRSPKGGIEFAISNSEQSGNVQKFVYINFANIFKDHLLKNWRRVGLSFQVFVDLEFAI